MDEKKRKKAANRSENKVDNFKSFSKNNQKFWTLRFSISRFARIDIYMYVHALQLHYIERNERIAPIRRRRDRRRDRGRLPL